MLQAPQIEALMCTVATLDRPALTEQFLCFRGPFPIDFTAEFLERLSVDRLRHIFVAMCLQCEQMPESMSQAALARTIYSSSTEQRFQHRHPLRILLAT